MSSTLDVIPKTAFAEGLTLSEKNGNRLHDKALQAFRRKDFVCAYILGFSAWEEFGKALLILKHWNEEFIERDTWNKEFIKHLSKIRRAKYISDKALLEELGFLSEDVEIRLDEKYLRKMHEMRTSSCLYVDFDFEEKVWKSPMQIDDKLHNWVAEVIIAAEFSRRALQAEKKEGG